MGLILSLRVNVGLNQSELEREIFRNADERHEAVNDQARVPNS